MATLIRVDRNGTKYYSGLIKCDRCGGAGGADKWKPTGWTCYKCGGSGSQLGTWKEYTPEYMAKLEQRRQARHRTWEEEHAEEIAEREAERQRRLAEHEAELQRMREEEEQERQRKSRSQWVGSIGDKVETHAVMEKSAFYEVPSFRGFGTDTVHVYTFRSEAGNALVWKTSSVIEFQEGRRVTVRGTVKEHIEYKEEKQTLLLRVKVKEGD